MTLMAVNGERVDQVNFDAVIEECTKAERPCKMVFQHDVELAKLKHKTDDLYRDAEKLFDELTEGGDKLARGKCVEKYTKNAHFLKDLFLNNANEISLEAFMAFLKVSWRKRENSAGEQDGNRGGGDPWLHNILDTLRKGQTRV